MSEARPEVKLFDKGFENVDELKARCLDETGLEPPVQAEFQKWVRIEQTDVQIKKAS